MKLEEVPGRCEQGRGVGAVVEEQKAAGWAERGHAGPLMQSSVGGLRVYGD